MTKQHHRYACSCTIARSIALHPTPVESKVRALHNTTLLHVLQEPIQVKTLLILFVVP